MRRAVASNFICRFLHLVDSCRQPKVVHTFLRVRLQLISLFACLSWGHGQDRKIRQIVICLPLCLMGSLSYPYPRKAISLKGACLHMAVAAIEYLSSLLSRRRKTFHSSGTIGTWCYCRSRSLVRLVSVSTSKSHPMLDFDSIFSADGTSFYTYGFGEVFGLQTVLKWS
jgi:hypothetical protein